MKTRSLIINIKNTWFSFFHETAKFEWKINEIKLSEFSEFPLTILYGIKSRIT